MPCLVPFVPYLSSLPGSLSCCKRSHAHLSDSYSVTNYSTKTAVLTLEHNHPPGNGLKALVDIELLLGSIKSHESRIGEWVNVMGYISAPKQNQSVQPNGVKMEVLVQAIVLWSAGPLKLDRYEEGLDQLKGDKLMALNNVP